ncbi:S8 family serine peptidase [candidate division KSB1 bacterium]|nr:S8 family serine peptidase [candidate division KSB1 bacterium]
MIFRDKMIYCFTCILVIMIQSAQSARLSGQPADAQGSVLPNTVVLALRETPTGMMLLRQTGDTDLDGLINRYHITHLEPLVKTDRLRLYKQKPHTRIDNIFFAHYDSPQSPHEVAAALRENPNVEFAEPKYIRHLNVTPNDSLISQQYHLNLIRASQAWDVIKGEEGSIVIAVVDGGTDINHPDLIANLWENPDEIPGNNLDDDQNGYIDDVHGARMADQKGTPARDSYLTGYGSHGTHTAGITAAVTNNGRGIAGVSWNARIMAVHAGSMTEESQIPYGYEGILYAVEEGARVISCSWGGSSRSEYEARITDYVNELGAVIVAAYGNDGFETEAQYPAAYSGVCGVAATNRYDRKASFSSYGFSADICAPGEQIYSLYPYNRYGYMSGTSMATPVAAGVISLIMTQNPSWSGLQAAEQLRVTADTIDNINDEKYRGKLGRGRVNAYRALTESWPSIRIEELAIVDQDSLIKPGEKIKITLKLKNYLAAAQNISLTLSENSGYAEMTKASATLTALATGEEKTLTESFEFQVNENAPSGHPIPFTLAIETGAFRDYDHFTLVVLPSFGTISINHISTTVTNLGRIGFGDPGSSDNGIGFKYRNGPNLLFEGAVIVGTGPNRISNAARGLIVGTGQANDEDFNTAWNGDLVINTPGSRSDQESIAAFEDSRAQNPLNVHITQQTFALNRDPFKDIVLVRYTVQNQSITSLSNFYFGLFFDWDMDGGSFATNVADYDAERRLGYVYDSGLGPDTYIGIQLLTDDNISYRAIYNDHAHPANPSWGLHDGFTDAEKWQSISGGLSQTRAGPADVSNVIASGPYTMTPNGTVQVDFAFIAGNDLQQLQQNADVVLQMYEQLFSTDIEEPSQPFTPLTFSLQQNYPNPFNGSTTIAFETAQMGKVELAVYDITGRKIQGLVDGDLPAGRHQVIWDGKDHSGRIVGSGAYFYRLETEAGFKYTAKMLFLK